MASDAPELVQQISEGVLATILIIGGAIVGLYGAKLHRAILFFVGFIAGSFLMYFFLHNVGIAADANFLHYSLIIAFIVGICIGCLTLWVYNIALFIIGAIAGMIIAQSLWHLVTSWFPDIQHPEIYNIIIVVLFAIIFGYIALKYIEVVIKPLTAFIGAYMVTSGSAYFIEKYLIKKEGENIIDIAQFFNAKNQCDAGCFVFLGVWILLFIIGLLYQYQVCQSGRLKLANIEDKEGVDDNSRDEAQDNLLQDV